VAALIRQRVRATRLLHHLELTVGPFAGDGRGSGEIRDLVGVVGVKQQRKAASVEQLVQA
jgi:hypothetical protein